MAVWLDDLFPDHPKVAAAGGDAAWLYVCGLCYCRRLLTDGRIPKPAVARLSDRKGPAKLAARLVAAGLWHDEGDHYRVHDWEDRNPLAESVKAARAERSDAARKAANARWGASATHADRMPNASEPHASPHAPRNANAMRGDAPRARSPIPKPIVDKSALGEHVGDAHGRGPQGRDRLVDGDTEIADFLARHGGGS